MTNAPFVVVSTFTGTASISFVSGFPLAKTSGVVEVMLIKGAAVVAVLVAFLGAIVVVDCDDVVVYLLVVVRVLVVVVKGRFVVVLVGFVVIRKGFVVVLLGGGFVILKGFVVVRVGFGLVTDGFAAVVVVGLLVAFVGIMLVLFSTVKLEAFCTDWNVVTFTGTSVTGAAVVTFFLTVVVGSLSLVVTGFAVVVFVTLKGGSRGGMIAKSILLSIIS